MKESVEQYIERNGKQYSIGSYMFKILGEKNLVDSDVYKPFLIDRRTYNKIINDKNKTVSKKTACLLALGLHLNKEESQYFTKLCGVTLLRSKWELAFRYCINNGIYNIEEIEKTFDEFGVKLFDEE